MMKMSISSVIKPSRLSAEGNCCSWVRRSSVYSECTAISTKEALLGFKRATVSNFALKSASRLTLLMFYTSTPNNIPYRGGMRHGMGHKHEGDT